MKSANLSQNDIIQLQLEACRIDFWTFCKTLLPQVYKYSFQRTLCEALQRFITSDKHFLVINMPPRHCKSLTAQLFTAWLFGNNPNLKIMTASYNEKLSTTFATNVRNIIQTLKLSEKIVYPDIFPTRVKYGEASAQMWAIEGQTQKSYLATSPQGSSTGFGADIIFCDDTIRSAEEAFNENVLEDQWSWFTNTMMSRLEGKRKVIIVATRWATRDLSGRILDAFDCETVNFAAHTPNGMLCPEILDETSYNMLKQEMSAEILEANYNQKPIDIQGRLYSEFKTWETLPDGTVMNATDTADTGTDFLCSINYVVSNNECYVTDVICTDAPMEVTEPAVAKLLLDVNTADIESNNGGRGFARNVERILRDEYHSNKCVIRATPQTHNKESRILASSAWVQNHVYMPLNWKTKYPEFYKQLMSYQKKGKNAHDDACDVMARLYELTTNDKRVKIFI